MTPLLCQFTLCPITNLAELINLITVVSTFMYEQDFGDTQNMTANITGKKNASMNDSGNIFIELPMPVHLPFSSEITGS